MPLLRRPIKLATAEEFRRIVSAILNEARPDDNRRKRG
jgi:hypothetical protein